MPQATNVIVNNAAAVAKTFALAAPASGVSPAVWFLREGANQTVYPKLEISSDKIVKGSGRKVKMTLRVPTPVTSATGVVTNAGDMFFSIDAAVPALVPDSVRDDAIAFVMNIVATALLKETFKTGYAPT